MNRIIIKLTQNFGTQNAKTPLYHPQANPTERCNRSIKTSMKAYLQKTSIFKFWERIRTNSNIEQRFNRRRRNRVTRNREMGRKTEQVENNKRRSVEKFRSTNEKQEKYYNLSCRPISYEIREEILRREKTLSNKANSMAKKLNKNFEVPFFNNAKILPTTYETKNKKGKSNIKYIKKYIAKN